MSEQRQIEKMRLEILSDITDKTMDEVFKSKLEDAETIALDALYPYDNTISRLPNDRRLRNWQVRCAIELYKKSGTTNVQSYSENGLTVTYMTGLLSKELLNELSPPKAGVIK